METTYQIGDRCFHLDRSKAEAAYAAKRVINGRETLTFNLLPLRYEWAYDLYKEMKAAHWGPMSGDIQMHLDAQQWHSGELSEQEKSCVELCLGWLASLPRLPGAGLQHGIRMHVTAPELKLVLGRETQDANTRMEALLFAAQTFGLDIHACETRFRQAATLDKRQLWLQTHEAAFEACGNLVEREAQCCFGRAVFLAGACLKGVAFFALHMLMARLNEKGRCPGLTRMMSHILKDDACYLDAFTHLFAEASTENAVFNSPAFHDELRTLMSEIVAQEKAFLDQLPLEQASQPEIIRELKMAVDQLAHVRLRTHGLHPLTSLPPLPTRLCESLHVRHGKLTARREVLEIGNDDDL